MMKFEDLRHAAVNDIYEAARRLFPCSTKVQLHGQLICKANNNNGKITSVILNFGDHSCDISVDDIHLQSCREELIQYSAKSETAYDETTSCAMLPLPRAESYRDDLPLDLSRHSSRYPQNLDLTAMSPPGVISADQPLNCHVTADAMPLALLPIPELLAIMASFWHPFGAILPNTFPQQYSVFPEHVSVDHIPNSLPSSSSSCVLKSKKQRLPRNPRRFTSSRQFTCNQCKERFPSLALLTVHTTAIHSAYRCNVCQAKFTQRSNLQRHALKHVGFKPFQCVLCSKAYYRKDHLMRHLEVTHPAADPATSILAKLSYSECLDFLDRQKEESCPATGQLIEAAPPMESTNDLPTCTALGNFQNAGDGTQPVELFKCVTSVN